MTKIPMPSAGMWKATVTDAVAANGAYYVTLQLSVASPKFGVSVMVAYALAGPDLEKDDIYGRQEFSITRDGLHELARTFGNPMGTFQTFSSKEQAERRYEELVDLALKYLTSEPVRLPWAHRRAPR